MFKSLITFVSSARPSSQMFLLVSSPLILVWIGVCRYVCIYMDFCILAGLYLFSSIHSKYPSIQNIHSHSILKEKTSEVLIFQKIDDCISHNIGLICYFHTSTKPCFCSGGFYFKVSKRGWTLEQIKEGNGLPESHPSSLTCLHWGRIVLRLTQSPTQPQASALNLHNWKHSWQCSGPRPAQHMISTQNCLSPLFL